MKFAILSLVAAGALAASAGTADAQYRGGNWNRGYSNYNWNRSYSNYGNYNRGYSNYNWNRGYNSGFNLTIGGSRGVISVGSGNVYPNYGWSNYARPYYGGGYGYGRRW